MADEIEGFDPEHLALLRQHTPDAPERSPWNRWRRENPAVRPKLRGAHLLGAILRGADLQDADLLGVDLLDTNLLDANLQRADLQGADLRIANLQGAILQGANLKDVNLKDVNLQGADLSGANLRGAYLRGVDLRDANLESANLQLANLKEVNLQGANLKVANLQGANLLGANLQDANLQGANLQGADLQGADLRGADLWGADLRGADLQSADLQGADLRGADLWGADLRGADLQGARLLKADLSQVNLLEDQLEVLILDDEAMDMDAGTTAGPPEAEPQGPDGGEVGATAPNDDGPATEDEGQVMTVGGGVALPTVTAIRRSLKQNKGSIRVVLVDLHGVIRQRRAAVAEERPNSPEAIAEQEQVLLFLDRLKEVTKATLVEIEDGAPETRPEKVRSLLGEMWAAFAQWPRDHKDELVDGTWRFGLVGACAGVGALFGAPWIAATLGASLYGGKLVDAIKSIRTGE